ncbi:FG-GAP repeat protein [Candidatus Sumerlaeota bacterium]|nr:FG-GAP repeat protein [Candidatus Sumerlaeota bacterium]
MRRPFFVVSLSQLLLCMGLQAQSVTVIKTAAPPGAVAPGQIIDYTVEVSNPFGVDLAITSFLDFIPENTSYVSGTLTLDPFVPDSLYHFEGIIFNTADLPLPAFGTTTVEFSVRVSTGVEPGTLIVNEAATDHGISNTTVNTVISGPELFSLLDVDPPGLIAAGEVLTYTLTIANLGFGEATGVQIVAPVPALTALEPGTIALVGATGSVLYDSGSDSVQTDGAGITIPARSVAQMTYQVRVDAPLPDDTSIINTAQVNGAWTNTVMNFTVTLSDYIDLDAIPGNVVVTDLNPFDLTGFALAGCDFDDDGRGDLIIGDHLGNYEGTRSGVVHIVYGGLGLSDFVTLPDSGAVTTQILPPSGTQWFGFSLATGDFTGDGIDDVLIGAPGPAAALGPGQAFVIAGGSYTPLIDLAGGAVPRTAVSGTGSELLGWSMAGGDFDGDGVDDLILGAPTFTSGSGQPIRGRVLVLPGGTSLASSVNLESPPSGMSSVIGDPADLGIAGTSTGLAAGDMDGDQRAEIVIGASSAATPSGGDGSGKVFVILGSEEPVTRDLSATADGWAEYQSEFPAGAMGWSVAVGDVNGDGFGDAAMGAPEASWLLLPDNVIYSSAGVVFTLPGRSDLDSGVFDLADLREDMVTVFGELDGDRLGWDVAFGDHNGDGFDDLVMGAPLGLNFNFEPIGVAHLLLGSPRLRRQYLLPFAPTGILRFYADSGSESAFTSLETGDLNSDGYDDLFLGDIIYDPFGPGVTDSDEIHVFFGRPRAPRLDLAVVSEFGEADRALDPGEQIVLQFDQPVNVTAGSILPGDFHLTNPGASLGTEASLGPNANDDTQAVITLGSDFADLNIDGVSSLTSTLIDIGSGIRPGLITGSFNDLPAEDTGFINADDRGVDVIWAFSTVPAVIQRTTGGAVTVTDNLDLNRPDFAYTSHRLDIPPNALGGDTRFSIARPPASLSALGLRAAVQITDDDAGVPSFSQPATLTLEYRAEDLALLSGSVESLFRIYQVVPAGGASAVGTDHHRPGRVVLASGDELQLVSGVQTIDTTENTVRVSLGSLDPEGAGAVPGVFATLPVNPVEERQMHMGPASGGAQTGQSAVLTLKPGPSSAYPLHQIEFPGYVSATPGSEGSIRVSIRTANIYERSFASAAGAHRFPTQSGAVFTIETRDAAGDPVAFTSPVNVTVQFTERPAAQDTDTVDFSGVVGSPQQMRVVQSGYSTATGVDFRFVDRPQGIDLMAGTVSLEGLTGLTGTSGVGLLGAVINTQVEPVTPQAIIDALLGRTVLSAAERLAADVNGDGDLNIADVVRLINSPQ